MSLTSELAPVAAAAVAGSFAFAGVVWQSRKTRRVNTDEHAANSEKLDRIEQKVDRTVHEVEDLNERLDSHVREHRRRRGLFR